LERVVTNATPIISLAVIDKLSIFKELFGKVYVPKAVYNEIQGGQYPGYKELDSDLFEVISIKSAEYLDLLLNDLDAGEAESIVVAKEMNADMLIIDERLGYKIAQTQGLFAIGTLTVLLMAKNKGIIKKIKPLLDEMIEKGRWFSPKVYDYFLKSIGELE
jgi:predicted nucleic acid-binding protein